MYPEESTPTPPSDYPPAPDQNQSQPPAPPPEPGQNPAPPANTAYPVDPTPGKHEIRNPLSVMEPGEQVICDIKRHPVGMLGIYIMTGLVMIVTAVLAFVVAPSVITSVSRGQVILGGLIIFLLVGLVVVGFVFVAHKVYWGNSWVVTSDSITQITQTSLFNKQSSQLSLGNLEDVTAEQDGILPHMLNYGRLRVETAGERSKFLFPFCPNPSYYAKQILAGREAFEQGRRGEDEQRLYRQQDAYQPPPQAYQPPPAPYSHASYQPPPDAVYPAPPTYETPTYQAPPSEPAQPVGPPPPADYPAYQPPPTAYEPPPDNGVNIDTE